MERFFNIADANLADFPRLAGETDDAPRFTRAIAAASNGVLLVPKGEYDVATRITITNRCSLAMHTAAHIVASAKMDYVLFWDGAAPPDAKSSTKATARTWNGQAAGRPAGLEWRSRWLRFAHTSP